MTLELKDKKENAYFKHVNIINALNIDLKIFYDWKNY